MSRCITGPVQRPGQHILSHVYAALQCGVHTYTVSSCRKGVLGRPLLQLRSMLQLSPLGCSGSLVNC